MISASLQTTACRVHICKHYNESGEKRKGKDRKIRKDRKRKKEGNECRGGGGGSGTASVQTYLCILRLHGLRHNFRRCGGEFKGKPAGPYLFR